MESCKAGCHVDYRDDIDSLDFVAICMSRERNSSTEVDRLSFDLKEDIAAAASLSCLHKLSPDCSISLEHSALPLGQTKN